MPAIGETTSPSHGDIQLRAAATDPDGGNVSYTFGVWTGSGKTGTEVWSGSSSSVASGATGSVTLAPGTTTFKWNTPYYWAAFSTDGTLGSTWTDGTKSFEFTNSPPPAPALDTPGSSTTEVVSTAAPTFTVSPATDADGDAVKYQFQVATGSTGQTGIVATSAWQTGTTWAPPAGSTLENGVYYWTAKAEDSYNTASGWTTPKQFTVSIDGPAWVGDVTGDTTVQGSETLQVAAASTVTAATFQLWENGAWQTLGAATAGTDDTWSYSNWDTTTLPDGAYQLQVILTYSGTTTTTYSGPLVWVENHGPTLANETTGGSNPAEPDVRNPASKLTDSGTDAAVDDTTGELDVTHQDLGFDGGHGIPLAVGRSYSRYGRGHSRIVRVWVAGLLRHDRHHRPGIDRCDGRRGRDLA